MSRKEKENISIVKSLYHVKYRCNGPRSFPELECNQEEFWDAFVVLSEQCFGLHVADRPSEYMVTTRTSSIEVLITRNMLIILLRLEHWLDIDNVRCFAIGLSSVSF